MPIANSKGLLECEHFAKALDNRENYCLHVETRYLLGI